MEILRHHGHNKPCRDSSYIYSIDHYWHCKRNQFIMNNAPAGNHQS